jgi:hypothetical protein
VKYIFTRACGPKDWRALPRQFEMRETVESFSGHVYGLVRDDLMYADRETIAVVDEQTKDKVGFFTCPIEFLANEKGERPPSEYIRIKRKEK